MSLAKAVVAPHFCLIKFDLFTVKLLQLLMSKPVTIKIKNGTVRIANAH